MHLPHIERSAGTHRNRDVTTCPSPRSMNSPGDFIYFIPSIECYALLYYSLLCYAMLCCTMLQTAKFRRVGCFQGWDWRAPAQCDSICGNGRIIARAQRLVYGGFPTDFHGNSLELDDAIIDVDVDVEVVVVIVIVWMAWKQWIHLISLVHFSLLLFELLVKSDCINCIEFTIFPHFNL